MPTTISCWPGWYPGATYPGPGANDGSDFPAARRIRWIDNPALSIVDDPPEPTLGGTPQILAGVKADKHY